jgi:hypothetical protein
MPEQLSHWLSSDAIQPGNQVREDRFAVGFKFQRMLGFWVFSDLEFRRSPVFEISPRAGVIDDLIAAGQHYQRGQFDGLGDAVDLGIQGHAALEERHRRFVQSQRVIVDELFPLRFTSE